MTHIDTSFDHLFATRENLSWWPWVGRDFVASPVRTLVVGESIYEWSTEDLEIFEKRYSQTSGLRETHERHAMNYGRPSKYVRNVERAVYCRSAPDAVQKHRFWTSVAYHNLVLKVLKSRSRRPSHAQFIDGWTEVLELGELLRVNQMLVFGVSSAKALKEVCKNLGLNCTVKKTGPAISNCRPRIGVVQTASTSIRLVFIRHPSEFFSWERWSPVIRSNLSFPPLV